MADGSSGLPSSNRGVSEFSAESPRTWAGIDWLSCSVDLRAVLDEMGFADSWTEFCQQLDSEFGQQPALYCASAAVAFFFRGWGIHLADSDPGRGRFYMWRVQLVDDAGQHLGMIEVGGLQSARGAKETKEGDVTIRTLGDVRTMRLELTGAGCSHIERHAGSGHAKRWLILKAKLESVDGRLTRLDCAFDDFDGIHGPISQVVQWWHLGMFDNRGQRPKIKHIDDHGTGAGSTVYVGSRASEKLLRAYEKGKEQGDPESPWVRYEGEFHATRRKALPLDMLRDPASYLRAAYSVLSFVSSMLQRIDVTKESAVATVKSCFRHLRRQYGKALTFFLTQAGTQEQIDYLLNSLCRPGVPGWAEGYPHTNFWPEVLGRLQAPPTEEENHE